LIFWWADRSAKKEFAAELFLREVLTTLFTAEGISSEGTGISSRVAWNFVRKIRETKSLFVVHYSASAGLIVPKRFFRDPEEMERWRQLVASCVDSKLIEKPHFFGRWCWGSKTPAEAVAAG
jgi:hypothetical protein